MCRVLVLLTGAPKSSTSNFSHILMFANSFPFCIKTILRFLALTVPLIATQLTAVSTVSNLTAMQQAGAKLEDISYGLVATGFRSVAVVVSLQFPNSLQKSTL